MLLTRKESWKKNFRININKTSVFQDLPPTKQSVHHSMTHMIHSLGYGRECSMHTYPNRSMDICINLNSAFKQCSHVDFVMAKRLTLAVTVAPGCGIAAGWSFLKTSRTGLCIHSWPLEWGKTLRAFRIVSNSIASNDRGSPLQSIAHLLEDWCNPGYNNG